MKHLMQSHRLRSLWRRRQRLPRHSAPCRRLEQRQPSGATSPGADPPPAIVRRPEPIVRAALVPLDTTNPGAAGMAAAPAPAIGAATASRARLIARVSAATGRTTARNAAATARRTAPIVPTIARRIARIGCLIAPISEVIGSAIAGRIIGPAGRGQAGALRIPGAGAGGRTDPWAGAWRLWPLVPPSAALWMTPSMQG